MCNIYIYTYAWYAMIKQHSWRSDTYLFHPVAILDTLTSTRAGGFFESWSETSQLHQLLCNLRATAAANSTAQWYAATHGSPGWSVGICNHGTVTIIYHGGICSESQCLILKKNIPKQVGWLSGSRAATACERISIKSLWGPAGMVDCKRTCRSFNLCSSIYLGQGTNKIPLYWCYFLRNFRGFF